MSEDTYIQIMWTGLVVFGFLGLLILPAAIIESRWGRKWVRRLQDLEMGRVHQQALWIEAGCKHGGPQQEDQQ